MEAAAVEGLFAEAFRHHQAGRLGDAEQLYRRILAVAPRHADSHHSLGVIALQIGQFEAAADLIGQAIALNGRAALYHSNLGLALQNIGKLDEATQCFIRALALKADYPEAHNNLGFILLRERKLDEAAGCFKRALAFRPNYAEAHSNLADVLGAQGNIDQAAGHYEQALALRPDLAQAQFNLGNIFHRQGKLHAAAARFERALALLPTAEAHSNLGNVFKDLGRGGEAAVQYEKAIALRPDFATAHFNFGNLLRDQGQIDQALARYEQAVTSAPDLTDAQIAFGNALLLSGRLDDALACFRRLVAAAPALAEGHYSLAGALMEQGNLDAAVAEFTAAAALKPDYADAQFNLGNALNDQGKSSEAAACFEKALALTSPLNLKSAEIRIALGNTRLAHGRRDEAYALFREAQRLQPLSSRAAARPKADFSVLLLTAPGTVNTPSAYLIGRTGYESHFLVLLPGGAYDVDLLRARGDVVMNLISDVDEAADALAQAADLVDRIGRPILNHPRKILATTRDQIAGRLAGLPHCRIPRTLRLPAGAAPTFADLAFPLLARISGTHGGKEFEKFANAADALEFIGRHPDADHYAIEYIPYESADGYFRKYRLIFVDGEVFPYHLAIADQWKVHHFRTDMANQDWMRAEEQAFVGDPTSVFSPEHWQALRDIRQIVGLDYFGIDCGLDQNGNLVVFEVNATMLVHDEKSTFAYKAPYIARIKQAFDAMLQKVAGN